MLSPKKICGHLTKHRIRITIHQCAAFCSFVCAVVYFLTTQALGDCIGVGVAVGRVESSLVAAGVASYSYRYLVVRAIVAYFTTRKVTYKTQIKSNLTPLQSVVCFNQTSPYLISIYNWVVVNPLA